MSKASQLQGVLRELLIKDSDREPYTSDAIKICNELMDDLKKVDSQFQSAYDGLSLSGSYLDRVKLKTPDEFDMHLKLKLPFQLQPERDNQRDGFVFIRAAGYSSHPAVVNGRVNRITLQDWLRSAFKKVFERFNGYKINGREYILRYVQEGYGCAHTIEARSSSRFISFDFVPVFEFNYNEWPLPTPPIARSVLLSYPWFTVPQQKRPENDYTFMVCAPHWEREMMKGNYNLKNILRLMKGLRDKYSNELPHLSSYMLKTVILLQLNKRPQHFWQLDLATVFMAMWAELYEHLRIGNLPFFLAEGCNHFDRMRKDVDKCKQTVGILMHQLNSNISITELFL